MTAESPPGTQPGQIIMVATSLQTMGGISAVTSVYRDAGLFRRWGISYVASHVDGSALAKAWQAMSALMRYLRLISCSRVKLVHVHSASRASFWRKSLFVVIARLFRVPCLFHLHGGEFLRFFYDDCGNLGRRYIRHILTSAAEILVLSDSWKKSMSSIVPDARISVLPNPVIGPGKRLNPERDAQYDILMLGGLTEAKGFFVLLDAVARLTDRFPDIRVGCAGDGNLDAATQRIQALNLSGHIDILGWVDKPTRDTLLTSSSLLVLPSFAEGLPMSILEAMAAGLPVVATSVGGIPDAIESGVHGLLVGPGDTDALTDALVALLADPDLRQRVGEAGRVKFLREFSVDVVIPRLEEIYGHYGALPSRADATISSSNLSKIR